MALVQTIDGALHYEVGRADRAVATRAACRSCSITASAAARALWRGWYPALVDRYPLVALRHARLRALAHSRTRTSPGRSIAWSRICSPWPTPPASRASIWWANRSAARWRWPRRSRGRTASPHSPSATARISAPPSAASHAWKKQLDEGGSAGWSKAFMPDRFHADALTPRAVALVRGAAGQVAARLDPQCARRADWRRSHAAAGRDQVPDPAAASRRQSLHSRCRSWLSCTGCCPMPSST